MVDHKTGTREEWLAALAPWGPPRHTPRAGRRGVLARAPKLKSLQTAFSTPPKCDPRGGLWGRIDRAPPRAHPHAILAVPGNRTISRTGDRTLAQATGIQYRARAQPGSQV